MFQNLQQYLGAVAILLLFGYIFYNEKNKEAVQLPAEVNIQQPPEFNYDELGKTKSYNLPAEMHFAGERVPLEIADVRERLDREIHINIYWHNNTIFLIKRAARWLPQIEEILAANNIPQDFKYMAVIESSLLNDISSKNAVGFWQFLKGTAKDFGLEVNNEVDERYHPLKATEAACRYLQKAHERFGNWTLVAASYDRGMSGLDRALEDQQVNSYYDLLLNDETYRYVFRILAAKEILESPIKYGFDIHKDHLYAYGPVTELEVNETIADLVDFASRQGINYKTLKVYNPWLRSKKLTVRGAKTYQLLIPGGQ